MTESEWKACADPVEMLTFLYIEAPLQGVARSERKLQLFGAACGRHVWDNFPRDTCRRGVELAERFADGLATAQELTKMAALLKRSVFARNSKHPSQRAWRVAWRVSQPVCHPPSVSLATVELLGESAAPGRKAASRKAESVRQCKSLREIFGNPFRPVSFDPAWKSDTALSLARHIYEARDFAQMPILADALQDAGCDNVDILSHCRDTSATHVRGCWVVDIVLGKS